MSLSFHSIKSREEVPATKKTATRAMKGSFIAEGKISGLILGYKGMSISGSVSISMIKTVERSGLIMSENKHDITINSLSYSVTPGFVS